MAEYVEKKCIGVKEKAVVTICAEQTNKQL
jgi:hypothetical protein